MHFNCIIFWKTDFKVELSFKVAFKESPLKIMKNTIYFVLKALFVHMIFKFLSCLFGHVEKATAMGLEPATT